MQANETFDLIAFAWSVATNPATGWAMGGLVGFVLTLVFQRYPQSRAAAQAIADYTEAIERQAVIAAELAGWVHGIRGYDKLLYALDYVEARLAERGIVGDANAVTAGRIASDLQRIKGELFPGSGTALPEPKQAS